MIELFQLVTKICSCHTVKDFGEKFNFEEKYWIQREKYKNYYLVSSTGHFMRALFLSSIEFTNLK